MTTSNAATRDPRRTEASRTIGRSRLVSFDLDENSVMRLSRRGVEVVVRVDHGTVLVTRQGDLEDHVLEAGDELRIRSGDLAVAWAFTDATLSLREEAG
jgi:Protein of unknown function (DUF2917)